MAKPGINLGALDLNLLTVFDAIMVERNVTRAATRVGLSQPATSHALNRLRHMLRDDLFIRSPKGMQPTPRAEQLAPAIRTALAGLQQALEPARFEASEATRQFRIAVDNYSAVVLVGALAGKLAKLAPKATLECRPSGTLPVHDMLDRGELDLALGPYGAQGERFSHRPLLIDDFVVVMRGEHPAAQHKNLSMAAFAALPHLEITSIPFTTDFIDEALAAEGLRRRVQLRAPLLSSVRILAASDMVTVMRRRIAEAKSPAGAWDTKLGPGRMQEIELVAQAGAALRPGGPPSRIPALSGPPPSRRRAPPPSPPKPSSRRSSCGPKGYG